jgi:multidrug efflux system outer membrane protein
MSAYYEMMQRASAVGLSRAARMPSITISASGGTAVTDISKLFSSKGWAASVLASVMQPIFNFGGLRRSELAAREAYKQSLLAYEQCYIEALGDVESALVAITTSEAQTERCAALVMANANAAQMTRALYDSGLSNYFDLMDAERTLYTSQQQLIALVAQQYINYVTLFKALGGGF